MTTPSPEVQVPASLASDLAEIAGRFASLEPVEACALDGELAESMEPLTTWRPFAARVASTWRTHDHVVLRGMPEPDPACLMLALLAVGNRFRRYRQDKVVKRFVLSPWTRALSHTVAEGHFHTDLNTAAEPPRVTAIQCIIPDPAAPERGELRVARVNDLVRALNDTRETETLRLLHDQEVAMVSDSEPGAWRGRMVEEGVIRFHPETLRAAERRFGRSVPDLEHHLAIIKRAALAVSTPIQLASGDVLIVSNRRAMHYRGACSVRFRSFPREFDSRSVHVLHLMDEPA